MSELNPNQSDLVLGGQNPPPLDAAILGGLAGAKQRLNSQSISERLQGLSSVVHYGENGIDLAIRALNDDDISVQSLASKLLRYQFGAAGEDALYKHASYTIERHYDPFIQINRANDPKIGRVYEPTTGIKDPEDVIYIVKIAELNKVNKNTRSQIDILIEDPNISSLRSLIVELDFLFLYHWIRDEHLIADLMHPILMKNITPALKSLGINYKCDEYPRPRIADEVKQKARHGTFELVFNSLIARQNLKYLSVQMPTSQMAEYLTTEKIDNLKNSVPYKSFDIIKNLRVTFG
jgi:hypothetical protein